MGIVIAVKLVQWGNASFPIDFTELPIVTFFKPVQEKNARLSIEVTELGIVIAVKLVQEENAQLPIDFTELPIVTSVKPLQPANALLPIEVTELGMTMVFSDVSSLHK